MRIEIIRSTDTAAMAAMGEFVSAHRSCHFLQMPQWRQVKPDWRWQGVLLYDGDRLVGTASVLIRPLPLGLSLLYCPRGPVCDRNDEAVLSALLDGIDQIAKENRSLLVYMDPDEPDGNEEFRKRMARLGFREDSSDDFGNIQPQFVFRMDIRDQTEDQVFARFSQKTRYNIRLAKRHGVSVRAFAGSGAIPEEVIQSFSALMAVTGERDGFLVRDGAYFRRLLTALGTDAMLFLAEYQGTPIAGSIATFCGDKAWYLYGASANEHRRTMPNYLLQWEMLREAIRRGCGIYDFRGVSGDLSENNPLYGLYRFKKGFRGDLTKFTGLFTKHYRPILSTAFELLRKLRG